MTLSEQQEVYGCGCPGKPEPLQLWARLYAVMILPLSGRAGKKVAISLGTNPESTPFAPSPFPLLSLRRDKKSSIDTAPRPGGSCTISSWDSSPYPGIPEPQKWSPTRCLHPPGGRQGLGGQDPLRLLTPWPARGTFSAPCSILDCQPCLSQGRAREATRAQAAWVH